MIKKEPKIIETQDVTYTPGFPFTGIVKKPDCIEYYYRGKRHRVGGPATVFNNGTIWWSHHGLIHREDGPAVTFFYGHKEWWLDDKRVFAMEVFEKYFESWSPERQIEVLFELDEWRKDVILF